MRIGIDGNEANIEQKVGVHQYAFEILCSIYNEELAKLNDKDRDTYTIYLRNKPRPELPKEKLWWKYKQISGGRVWIFTKLMPHLLWKKEIDVLFSPSHYLPPFSRIPMILTVHDLGYLEFSGQFKKYDFWQLKLWSAISFFVSKRIIAVSEATKKDIVRHYKFTSKKTEVVLHGYDSARYNLNIEDTNVRRVKDKYKINGEYLLFLSTLKPSKNIDGLLRAYRILLSKNSVDTTLVIAGKKGWMFESLFTLVEELKIKNKVVFTDFVEEDDKPALIYGAKVFILPSHWEGFGMPILESMACGTPVVLSKIASLPEVAGSAGEYVDPLDPESIAAGLEKILKMKRSEYDKLVKRSVMRASNFAWQKSAIETLRIIKSCKKLNYV